MIRSSAPTTAKAAAGRILGSVLGAVVVTDQLTKAWAVEELPPGRVVDLLLGVRLVHARNTGVAFSQGRGMAGIIVPILVVIGLIAWSARTDFNQPGGPRRSAAVGYGLILGGALGNVIDRLCRGAGWGRGAVIDMVDVGFWPVFNLADAALCIGVGITLLSLFWSRRPAEATPQVGDP